MALTQSLREAPRAEGRPAGMLLRPFTPGALFDSLEPDLFWSHPTAEGAAYCPVNGVMITLT